VVVAKADAGDDDVLAKALLAVGCVRAIAARGGSDEIVTRAGVGTVMNSYPQTTLYALAQPMGPRAFRFDKAADGTPLFAPATTPVP
jgi:hypothetical protein